jgi:hypothetical protein
MTLGVNFFALYDTLVYYMTYKDAIAPSTIYDKNKEILTIKWELVMLKTLFNYIF